MLKKTVFAISLAVPIALESGFVTAVHAIDGATVPGDSRRDGVAGLPRAGGRVFYSLDEYLAYLEKLGASDIPFYRKLADGRYERIVGRSANRRREIVTRSDLLRKFGFAR